MVAYEMGNTPLWLTEQYLCDQLYIQSGHGATTEEIIDSLELNLPSSGNYIPTQTYSVLSQSDITTVIGNLDPACMLMLAYRNGSNSGTIVKKHTCALYGYSFTNSISKIYVMEPHNYEKILVTKTGSNYIIPIEQYNFYWEDTIRLYYNL